MKNGSKTLALAIVSLCAALSPLPAREGVSVEEGRGFWAFQPLSAGAAPKVNDAAWPIGEIDRFVLARLEADGAGAPAAADPRSLIRRLSFDLRGLPPSPDEVAAFVADSTPQAYAHLVDSYIGSREFAERWARRWLGTVRYADSTGGGRAILLPDAWRYRDYVIDSFHTDKPYDRFVMEHLAGDLMEHADPAEKRAGITATGFLAMGPTNYELQDKERLRMDVVDEQIDTIGKAFMGMTVGCARCHDHFFDPIPTRDYYALAGIFRSTKTMNHSNVSEWVKTTLPAATESERKAEENYNNWTARLAELKGSIAKLKTGGAGGSISSPTLEGIVIDDKDAVFVGNWVASTSVAGFVGDRYMHDGAATEERSATFERQLPKAGRYEVRVSYTVGTNRAPAARLRITHADGEREILIDQRQPTADNGFKTLGIYRFKPDQPARVQLSNSKPGNGHLIADSIAFVPLEPGPEKLDPKIAQEELDAAHQLRELEKELKAHEKRRPSKASLVAMSVEEEKQPADYAVNLGGDPHNLGDPVSRGIPSVMAPPGSQQLDIQPGQSGRLEFARWLASPQHPLTARVYANRVWMWLTGEGIVASPNNFGSTGELPSNPRLLDHLGQRLIDGDWSTKSLVREIVLSRSYQAVPTGAARRLDAEALRDAMLSVSGELDRSIENGPSIAPGTKTEIGYQFNSLSRSVFQPIFRNQLPQLFDVFDFPDPSIVAPAPGNTTLSTQALFLMNNPWVFARATATGKRWMATSADTREAVQLAYLTCFGREPDDTELSLSLEFLGNEPDDAAWTTFAQSLFASLEFRHLH